MTGIKRFSDADRGQKGRSVNRPWGRVQVSLSKVHFRRTGLAVSFGRGRAPSLSDAVVSLGSSGCGNRHSLLASSVTYGQWQEFYDAFSGFISTSA